MRTTGALLLGFALAGSLLVLAHAAEWQTYLEEDFSSAQTMFYTGQAGEAQYSIDEMGRYVIDGINTGSDSLSSLTDNLYYYYLEAQCEVDKTIAGEQAFTGVVFHYNKSIPGKLSYYVFYVFGDGYYGAKRVIGDQVDIIIPLTPTDQLDLYGVNVLAVDAQGTSFDLYLNGRFIDGFTDVRIDGGGFGFYVSKHARAAFDNFKVKVERRGGGPEDMPAAVTSNVADEGGTADVGIRDYSFPVIPKDPNRPTYSWEVGVDKTRKAKPAEEEPAAQPEPEPEHEPDSVPVVEAPAAIQPQAVVPAEPVPQTEQKPAPAEPATEPSPTDGTESLRSVQLPPGEEILEPTPAPAAASDGAVEWVAEKVDGRPQSALNEGEAQDITPVQAAEEITPLPAPEPEPEPVPEPETIAPVQLPAITVPSIDVPDMPQPEHAAASAPPEDEPMAAAEPEPAAAAEPEPEPAAVMPAPVMPEIEYVDAEPDEELALFPAELVADAPEPAPVAEPEPAPVAEPPIQNNEMETSAAPVVEEATPELTAPEVDSAAVEPHVDEQGELSVYSALPADAPPDVAPHEEPAAEPEPAMELSLLPEPEQPAPEPEPELAPVIEEPAPAEPETSLAAAEITPAAEGITPVKDEETPVVETAAVPEPAELTLFPAAPAPAPADEGTLGAEIEQLAAELEAARPATDDAESFEPQRPLEQVTEPEAPATQAEPVDEAASEPIADDQPTEEEAPSWREAADAMRDHSEWGATTIYEPAEVVETPAGTPGVDTAPAETPVDDAADGDAVPAVEADEGELRFASVEPKLEDLGVGVVPDDATPVSELDWRPVPLEPAAGEADTPLKPAIEPADEYYSGESLVVIADDFSAQHWPVSTDGSETYRYFGSAYEIDNLDAQTMAISFQDSEIGDSEFSVDIEFLDGVGYVGYGVASRLGVVNGVVSYYGLFICQNGELMLLKVHGGGEQVLVDWQATNLIRANQTNRIALDVRDGLLYAYINGALAATATDTEILSGGYALLAGPGVAVRFDNLRIHGFAP